MVLIYSLIMKCWIMRPSYAYFTLILFWRILRFETIDVNYYGNLTLPWLSIILAARRGDSLVSISNTIPICDKRYSRKRLINYKDVFIFVSFYKWNDSMGSLHSNIKQLAFGKWHIGVSLVVRLSLMSSVECANCLFACFSWTFFKTNNARNFL